VRLPFLRGGGTGVSVSPTNHTGTDADVGKQAVWLTEISVADLGASVDVLSLSSNMTDGSATALACSTSAVVADVGSEKPTDMLCWFSNLVSPGRLVS